MRSDRDLMPHQVEMIHRNVSTRQQANLVKMGLGKTAAVEYSLRELGVKRALVLAPAAAVTRQVWRREADEWEDLVDLRIRHLAGTQRQRLSAMTDDSQVEVVSYANLPWLCGVVGHLVERYDAIVFDELSRLKHPGGVQYRKMRSFSMEVPVRFGLTGSPVGNHLLDLWGEMFAVAGEKPLGPTILDYQAQYFSAYHVTQDLIGYSPRAGAAEKIAERIRPYAFSLPERVSSSVLPPVHVAPVDLQLPESVRTQEVELAGQCKTLLASGMTLEALDAGTLAGKVRQLASGAVYVDPMMKGVWEKVHDVKLDALAEIVEEQQGEPLVVYYWYKHELERLLERFPQARQATQENLDAWDRREVELLLLQPQSSGQSLNLQKGGSSICWFTLPYSHELWEQGNGRLARPGQPAQVVTVSALLAGEADRAVLELLKEKRDTQDTVVAGVTRYSQLDVDNDPLFALE